MKVIVFLQGDKSVRSVGAQELALCSKMRMSMTGQHDQQLKFWGGPVAILARHCPLTDYYFEPRSESCLNLN